ncbi:helix-turn-helix domain-containing protein [Sphingomonas sp. J344]|uniref:helix-turn-helix domain-containing protein n=1 Tax=Sphingomonas sp. J344 TaxID=2898434 RepID=UPI002150A67F|nr:helix-turn-helix domain-containing protein [Sphingomonas sp. J344]MCR5869907.1 helix-turn-helix domain-containing protein [Sphingomonas sp. J344]
MDGEPGDTPNLFPVKVGEKLRDARLAAGLELADIAGRTRVPQRHLAAIEASDYSGLPSPTYAVGFVKAYARAVGADEVALARELREETSATFAAREVYESYDPEDPVREPPSGLAWAGAIVAVLLLGAVGLWYGTDLFRGGTTVAPDPTPSALATPDAAPTAAATPASGGQVTLIATQPVWLRIYDAAGTRLYEKEMATGERYDVPADAKGPMINVGRPEAVQVTIDGVEVASLGRPGVAIKDVPISADALRARGQPTEAATPVPTPTPTPAAQRSPAARLNPAPTRSPAARPTAVAPAPVAQPTPSPVATATPDA